MGGCWLQASAEAGWEGGPGVHSLAAAGAFLLVLVPLQLLYRYRHGKENVCRKSFFFFFFPELYRFCSKPDTICKIWVWSNLEQNQKVSSPLENPKLPPALQLLSRIAASVDPSTANELLEHRAPKTSFSQTRPARNTCPVTLRQHFQGPQP